ncbi:MAG TPA: GNAT family N-acetyltransferase [bacterium]|nr:GNAT family N-acetyltransferase [bacterium]
MDDLIIRKGKIEDARDFSHLILLSAPVFFPSLFGDNVLEVMENLFRYPGNIFSFEHSYFVEMEKKIAGMVLGYTWKERDQEELNTGFLLFKYLGWDILTRIPYLLRVQSILGNLVAGDYYISNIAVYPEFRCSGLGTRLLEKVEEEAGERGCKMMVLDVEADNRGAISLYEKLGYNAGERSSVVKIKGKSFEFFRMKKKIGG